MSIPSISPNEQAASSVVTSMTGEQIASVTRMTTGDQHFVYAVKTADSEYVIRMTNAEHKKKFLSAIYWQKKLIPLGVPLAEFINSDLDEKYSPFPALLMMRLPGDDLCNLYSNLTNADKRNLANEIVKIQAISTTLPEGSGYGIFDSYEQIPEDKSWYDFLKNRLHLYLDHITNAGIFDLDQVNKVISIASDMQEDLLTIRATPFLWDASERNVLVHNGKITGIVDVDDMCFGDPLLVVGLTRTALELEGLDILYTDYWAEALRLDKQARLRLKFYRLFYAIAFMRKYAMDTTNSKKVMFDAERLKNIFHRALTDINNRDSLNNIKI